MPERSLGGWTYCQARPNANICNGGAWVWDDTAAYPWELAYRAEYSGLQLPPRAERDMRDFEWPNGVHVRVVEPLTTYAVRYSDPGALEVDLTFEAIMAPNLHPDGVVPFLKGAHFDQAGHVTGTMVLHGEEDPDRLLLGTGPVLGAPADGTPEAAGTGWPTSRSRPDRARGVVRWRRLLLLRRRTGRSLADVRHSRSRGRADLLRLPAPGGDYGHILAGERRVTFDAQTGWPLSIELEAVDEFDRRLSVRGDAVSRHWRGHGGDSLVHWRWDDGVEGWGEDQSYFSRDQWERNRRR